MPLAVTSNMVNVVSKKLGQAGSLENIKAWAHRTPRQRAIFGRTSLKKLILLGPWGCGKTLFLTDEAMKTAAANPNEKVIYLIFARKSYNPQKKKSMLALVMEEKFKEYPNITVETVFFDDDEHNNLMEDYNCKHIFVDEMFDDIESLEPASQEELRAFFSSKETIWVAMSNSYYKSKIGGSVDLEAWAKSQYPDDFEVVKMDTPLRMPANVSKDIKNGFSGMSKATPLGLNPRLMAECKIPSNLVEGCTIERFFSDELEPLFKLFEQAFATISKDNYAVIVIDDRTFLAINKYMRSIIKCKCRDIIFVLTVKLAMMKAGRKLTAFHCIFHSSSEELLKKLTSEFSDRDLVLSTALKQGYEHNVIIDITNTHDVSSRSSSKLINLLPNALLDMMVVYEKLLKNEGHNCDDIMDLSEEHLANINFSLLDLLGKFGTLSWMTKGVLP